MEHCSSALTGFFLSLAAGLSTTVGASFALCAGAADTRVLSVVLGLASGVMIYVAFVELFQTESIEAFIEGGYDETKAERYAALIFFATMGVACSLNSMVQSIHCRGENKEHGETETSGNSEAHNPDTDEAEKTIEINPPSINRLFSLLYRKSVGGESIDSSYFGRLNFMTGLVVSIHNFSEGIVTFIAARSGTTSAVMVAAAVAIHNIPEGVAVALLVFRRTKSRSRAIFWAAVSGAFEPIGALSAWLLLARSGDVAIAMIFAGTAGIMIYISFRDLIPTAFYFDQRDSYVTMSVLIAMALVAAFSALLHS